MGIERFFSSIESSSIINKDGEILTDKRISAKTVMFDFNSEIHTVSSAILSDINGEILKAIENKEKIPEYTEDFIDDLIINKVKRRLINVIKIFTYSDKVETIFIAFDGVPTMGKVIEQKRRRYLGYVLDRIKEDIYRRYKKTIDRDRELFLKHRVNFNKTKISPGTQFMYKIYNELNSDFFINQLKKEFKSLKNYSVSSYNEYGEGEMKIMWKANRDTLIVSPDSDVTLLGLLINVDNKNITILRYNQQKQIYNIINIDLLKKRLLEYCKADNTDVIVDLVILFTFFGNDFVPKVHSVNVKSGFKQIIDIYVRSYRRFGLLIDKDRINPKCFVDILRALSENEKNVLQETYVENSFKNYRYLKSVIGEEEFIAKLKLFLEDLESFNKGNLSGFRSDNFIKKLRQLVRSGNDKRTDVQFINDYREYKKKYGQFPKVNIVFRRYSDKIDKEFRSQYDEEIYKLENMKGEYRKLLGIKEIDLGRVYVDPQTYTFKEEKIDEAIERYYKGEDKKNMIKQFLTAFVFTFRHYVLSKKFIPVVWFYPYSRSPLISDIYRFVKVDPDYINRIKLRITDKYFTSVQHLAYTSPIEELKPEEFRVERDKEFIERLKNSIDCTGQIFISKCFIDTDNEDPVEFIKRTDKIKMSAETEKLIGTYDNSIDEYDIPDIITMRQFKN